ncbi:bifunctional adenosylcobinamide kinase/adenosylcobinamide-phosphate guanylyltransferase [filamentous cyanobacterium CCP5]|nr:bifunctional adenosylcobinamide kinase/adenosylcobinamide-phosphate guanylyltransferase [filamentous cyanobacterium CCP5]
MTDKETTTAHGQSHRLVTGPARSGKSEWAEQLAQGLGLPVTYIATGQADIRDEDWMTRIRRHRQRRPNHWQLQEVAIDLPEAIAAAPAGCLLVDSLGTWTANLLPQSEAEWQAAVQHLLRALAQTRAQVIFVAEETGWGVVPAYPMGRQFRDRLGDLTRRVAITAQQVYLVTAGYAVDLKALGQPVTGLQ